MSQIPLRLLVLLVATASACRYQSLQLTPLTPCPAAICGGDGSAGGESGPGPGDQPGATDGRPLGDSGPAGDVAHTGDPIMAGDPVLGGDPPTFCYGGGQGLGCTAGTTAFEPNDSQPCATMLPLGSAVTAAACDTDVDWYRLDPDGSPFLSFRVASDDPREVSVGYPTDCSGGYVYVSLCGSTTDSGAPATACRIRESSLIGPYCFSVTRTNGYVTNTTYDVQIFGSMLCGDGMEESEPNDMEYHEHMVDIGTACRAAICGLDEDRFKVYAPNPATLHATLTWRDDPTTPAFTLTATWDGTDCGGTASSDPSGNYTMTCSISVTIADYHVLLVSTTSYPTVDAALPYTVSFTTN